MDENLRPLVWRSRRGMLELDLLLAPFVEAELAGLDERTATAYRRLLECEDSDLYAWLVTHTATSGDPELDAVIARIEAFRSRP